MWQQNPATYDNDDDNIGDNDDDDDVASSSNNNRYVLSRTVVSNSLSLP